MRIVHVVETWVGGIATYVGALAREQIALGNEVMLICDPDKMTGATGVDGLTLVGYRSSRHPARIVGVAREIRALLKALDADVIHCHSTFPGLYVRLSRHRGARVLYTPHAWAFLKRDVGVVTKLAYALTERVLAGRCDKIVCMSLDELKAARKYRIPMSKVDLIYTGIAGDDASAVCVRAPEGAPIRVGYFGRLDYQKGFDVVLDAVPALRASIEINVYGVAVRGGVAASRADDRRIVYHGWVDAAAAKAAMQAMDVVIVPSRWEGLALVPIEAMRAGKVLVVSGESSLPEQVIHGYNGIILTELTGQCLADNLNRLTIDECLRMGGNARHVFDQTFRQDHFLKSLMLIYEKA
ncbi:MAG: glycosyltransferase family 4 protein [Burkholderia sp.]|jgi:glycosyltransferase involved in cell wall biosynthesis|uniref:glycosyltransferase family 4 protein n=1 Tax=Burkholderia sp. TaxID=36773 RepID=UPI00282BDF73|nr:glycosyltransferase family 4 protein [Burkholderia sp.]MDR0241444.1 glycosyltransferase family 4 protein [Burkholderia sp.]